MIRKLLIALLLAAPLAAQDAQLFIERIEVRNHERVSPHVVIAESRLHEGRTYTEAELRDAATRLSRLPFLLSVDFSLEKGSERGQYVLVLSIHETKTLFFLLDGVPYFNEGSLSTAEDDDDRPGTEEDLVLGFRWFVGRRGAVHIAFGGGGTDHEFAQEYTSFSAGYTQYDLFGTRAFATLNLRKPVDGLEVGLVSPQLVVGVPITANQTVTLEYDESRFDGETRLLLGTGDEFKTRHAQRTISARLSYNTTNEPFFPTSGTLLHVTPMYGWADGARIFHHEAGPDGPRSEAGTYHHEFYGAKVGATRYFELTDRDSVYADLRGEWATNEQRSPVAGQTYDQTSRVASIGAGYSRSFWTREERANGDSRLELTARFGGRTILDRQFAYDRDTLLVSAAWLRRSSFGTLRLGVGYAW